MITETEVENAKTQVTNLTEKVKIQKNKAKEALKGSEEAVKEAEENNEEYSLKAQQKFNLAKAEIDKLVKLKKKLKEPTKNYKKLKELFDLQSA